MSHVILALVFAGLGVLVVAAFRVTLLEQRAAARKGRQPRVNIEQTSARTAAPKLAPGVCCVSRTRTLRVVHRGGRR